jgi:glycosyltransferase involved in cell wall biosynthesis
VYAAADLIIMPAAFETFGMATLEALYANCPVVGANNGGTAELINLYHGGCLFEYDNPADLNLAINRVLSNEFECAKRKAIQQHFDLTSVCSRIEKEVLH